MGTLAATVCGLKDGGKCVVRHAVAGDAARVLECAREAFATSVHTLTKLDEFVMTEDAERDFVAARAAASDAADLNGLCWEKTMAGVALERALDECTAALALTPDSAGIIDSRGWVYVRLGRHREAIADFDRALTLEPDLSGSLYGRAMAWHGLGDAAKARADRDAAFAVSASVDREFRDAGILLELD